MVMQLRDEGRLSLDDLLGDHVPEVSHPLTIRQCLAHVSGMAREPLGDVWETLEQPDAKTAAPRLRRRRAGARPHDHWHYSNVVYAMLGQLVEELDGRSWEESLRTRLLEPLEMTRTSVGFDGGPHVTGYYVAPYDDVPRPEPVLDLKAMAPCGGLASTADDLAKLVGVRGRSRRSALRRHDRGDVPAADPARPPTRGTARWVSASS